MKMFKLFTLFGVLTLYFCAPDVAAKMAGDCRGLYGVLQQEIVNSGHCEMDADCGYGFINDDYGICTFYGIGTVEINKMANVESYLSCVAPLHVFDMNCPAKYPVVCNKNRCKPCVIMGKSDCLCPTNDNQICK